MSTSCRRKLAVTMLLGTILASIVLELALPLCGQARVNSSTHPVYRNFSYGFEIALPPNLIYERTQPPNPDHGLGITVNDNTQVWVDSSYTDSASTQEELEKQVEGCQIKDKRSTMLGGIPAMLVHFSCPSTEYEKAYDEQLALAVRHKKKRSPISYQIGRRTTGVNTDSTGEELFQKLMMAFKYLK